MKELPAYLFVGFLDDGKTSFISETLADPAFCTGERTLLILCEEGETEYDSSKFINDNVVIETIDDEKALTESLLSAMEKKHKPSRVLIEYNGMWELPSIYNAMPKHWFIYQNICIANAAVYTSYLTNMRKLCFDKLQDAEAVLFNRCTEDTDKAMLHRTVRSVNRGANIMFERCDGSIDEDDIIDELPFDKKQSSFSVKDEDYGLFYLDIMEHPEQYEGKHITFKAYVCRTDKVDESCIVAGRFGMTCCAEDISFIGLVCEGKDANTLIHRTWVMVSGDIKSRRHDEIYGGMGPWLVNAAFSPAEVPKEELVRFN